MMCVNMGCPGHIPPGTKAVKLRPMSELKDYLKKKERGL